MNDLEIYVLNGLIHICVKIIVLIILAFIISYTYIFDKIEI